MENHEAQPGSSELTHPGHAALDFSEAEQVLLAEIQLSLGSQRDDLDALIQAAMDRKSFLSEQLALEELVRLPPRKGHLPHYADEDMVTRLTGMIGALERVIEKLQNQMRA